MLSYPTLSLANQETLAAKVKAESGPPKESIHTAVNQRHQENAFLTVAWIMFVSSGVVRE